MIDPRISLAAQAPQFGVGSAINIFETVRNNAQARELNQAQEDRTAALAPFQLQNAQDQSAINQQTIGQNRDAQRLNSLHQTGQRLKPLLASGDVQGAQKFLLDNISTIQGRIEQGSGEDVNESMETLAKLQSGDVQGVMGDIEAIEGLIGGGGQKQFALQSNAPIVDPNTGQVSTPVFNPATGQTSLVPIQGAIQNTPTQTAAIEFKAKQDIADLDIRTTRAKETIKKTVARNSELKTQYSTQRRLAANSFRKIKEAQKLSENATQGVAGVSKVQLGRLFPGIDTSNEAALTGAFKSLALDELQKFKGPTTDFEFRVTEDIAGSLGDGASANRARLASLERASWFSSREAKQFSEHQKAGHDPDEFAFNFNELVTPKKGGKSYPLQSIQDTAVANHISIDEVIKRLSK